MTQLFLKFKNKLSTLTKEILGHKVMYANLRFALLLIMTGLFSATSHAASLQDVSFASLPGDATEVTLKFDSVPPEPKGYTIEKPARIALDLSGVNSALSSRYHNLGLGNAKRMTVIETNDRTRVILDLASLVPYSTVVEGSNLVVTVGVPSSRANASNTAPAVSTSVASTQASDAVTAINFRRGQNGEGQVIVDLSNSQVDIDMAEVGGKIELTLAGVDLKESLRQRLDVVDFATPVQRIDSYMRGEDTIISIKPDGFFDYLAYQADNQFTVSVEPLTKEEEEDARKEQFPFTGEKLSLNFQDIEVRAVLQLIADFTGLNLVASDTVGGNITLRLQNVPWDQALELILKTKGLDKRTVGNVMLVAPADEIAAREKLEIETNKQVAELAPVRLEIIQINYAKAADIVALLEQDKELISERGYISSDERTNTISVRETTDKQAQIRKLVDTWDIPVRQVLIEARIVRARSNLTEDLGVQWGGGALSQRGDSLFTIGGSQETLAELGQVAAGNATTLSFPDALAIDLGVSRSNSSSVAIGFGTDNLLLDLELSAFEADGKGEIVAQPKIVTADRQTATIKSGEEIPYQEASSSGATSVSFKEAVLSLEVTPQITPDDKVIMDLKINQDNRGAVTAGIPSIETNEIATQVLVGNGETVVLGGIFQSDQSTTVTKTPFLGDLPYIGNLFRKTEEVDERAELLVFITPKLLKDGLIDD